VRGGARRHRHTLGTSADDDGSGEGHVASITDGGRLVSAPERVLRDRQRLARQERLVEFQSVRRHESEICRDTVARLQPHAVARHDVLRLDLTDLAVPHDGGADVQQSLERLRALLGPPLLVPTDQCVQTEHGRDERGVGRFTDRNRHHGGNAEYVDQRTPELTQSDLPPGRRRRVRQLVRSDSQETIGGFRLAQARSRRIQRLLQRRKSQHVPMARPLCIVAH